MGVLTSDELKDDPKLEACATIPSGHFLVGSRPGPHILKIQLALERLRPTGPAIAPAEKRDMRYGPTTAAAVLNYKKTHVPPIINTAYQHDVDPIVGEMTIKAMDADLKGTPLSTRQAVADRAHDASRAALRLALTHLRSLRDDINALPANSDPAFGGAIRETAENLGNTAAVARQAYVHPAVVAAYLDGRIRTALVQAAEDTDDDLKRANSETSFLQETFTFFQGIRPGDMAAIDKKYRARESR